MTTTTKIERTWKCTFCHDKVTKQLRVTDIGSEERDDSFESYKMDEHGLQLLPDRNWMLLELMYPGGGVEEALICPKCINRMAYKGDSFEDLVHAYSKLLRDQLVPKSMRKKA